jgi:hypothetical protein
MRSSHILGRRRNYLSTTYKDATLRTWWNLQKSKPVVHRLSWTALITFGSIPAASTRLVVPSCPRPSTQCIGGIKRPRYATHTWLTCLAEWVCNPQIRPFRKADGLQEDGPSRLIAPSSLVFYGKDWHEIGTKLSLQKLVWETTGIPINVLKFGDIKKVSVAQRMSWASKRQTTRAEDIAYCLMGLFGVNMPMLYGEGERAFERLQEEIMKTSDDHTLFAWTEPDNRRRITGGLLAESPAEFVGSGDIISSEPVLKSAPYSMTNKGLCIELPLFRINEELCFAILNCHRSSNADLLGIFLKKLSFGKQEYFARTFTELIDTISKEKIDESEQRTVYIIQKNVEEHRLQEQDLFRISLVMKLPRARDSSCDWKFYPNLKESRRLGDGCFQFAGRRTGVLGVLRPKHKENAKDFVVVLGHQEGLPWCDVVTDLENKGLAKIYDTYRGDTHVDRLDRIAKPLQAGMSVSVAVRKKGKEQKASEGHYDAEYAVHISVYVDSRD